jgi:hypothetical protein
VDERKAWLVMVVALAFSMAVYVVVGWFLVQGAARPGDPDLPVLPGSAVGAVLVAGAAAALARVSASPGIPSFRFRALSLLSLVVLETGVVLGLVFTILSHRMEPVAILAAAGLVGVVAFVVPAGNAHFRGRTTEPGGAPPLGPS